MDCPRCRIEMNAIEFKGVELDQCSDCEGVWFDHGELETVRESSTNEVNSSGLAKSMEGEIRKEEISSENELPCPRCGVTLTRFNYLYESGIILDTCPNDCGIWVDDGELKLIREYLDKAVQPSETELNSDLMLKLEKIKQDGKAKRAELEDDLVHLDESSNPVYKYSGKMLQFVYALMNRTGI